MIPFVPVTGVYHCAAPSGSFLLVTRTRPEGLSVFLPPEFGAPHRLLDEVAAGGRYRGQDTEVRLGEGVADLIVPEGTFAGCRYDHRASIWEHAKLNGADFRGQGNEPGWVLEVREQSRLWFSYDYGAGELSVPIVETRTDPESSSTTFIGRSEAGELSVTLTAATCADTMSDETYSTRVEIRLDDRTFSGCGRPLH